jgi:hypothetical protein
MAADDKINRRLDTLESEETQNAPEDLDVVVIEHIAQRNADGAVGSVLAHPEAQFPRDYEVTHESEHNNGGAYRVWELRRNDGR